MDDQRVAAAFRAVRIKRGWTQKELGRRAGVSPGVISLIERGHLVEVPTRSFRLVAGALGIRTDITLKLAHGELDRLVNAGHSAMHEAVARFFDGLPDWVHSPEVSFAVYSERGVIDILAFHPPTGALLVVELKTEIVAIEELLMTMDVSPPRRPHRARSRVGCAERQRVGRYRRERHESAPRPRPLSSVEIGVSERRPVYACMVAASDGPDQSAFFLG